MNEAAVLPSPAGRGAGGEGESRWKHALPPEVLHRVRDLRIARTDAERKLWYFLRNRRFGGLKFRRQHPVPPFVLDFFCEQLALGIELDGGQHNEDAVAARDAGRSRVLNAKGIQVVRFWNDEVLCRIEEVLARLWNLAFREDSPSPAPSGHPLPVGEGRGGADV